MKMLVEKKYEDFLNKLSEHEIKTNTKYVLKHSAKSFVEKLTPPTTKQCLHWHDDIPYFLISTRYYHCHHGKDLDITTKKKYAEKRDKMATMEHLFVKRNNRIKGTKKLDCPATVKVSRVISIPEHKLNGSCSRDYEKKKALKVIRKKIEDCEFVGEEAYIFNLPDISEHSNHPVGERAAVTKPVDRCQEVEKECEYYSKSGFPIEPSHSSTTYEEFLNRLKKHENDTRTKFVYQKSHKKFLDVKVALSTTNWRMHWQENVPYVNLGSITFLCHQGKDYNVNKKKKYAESREAKVTTDQVFTKRYNKVQPTKKVDCPARVVVRKVFRFIKHKVSGKVTSANKKACSRAIRNETVNQIYEGEECYIYNLPAEEDHVNHLNGQNTEIIEPLDKQVRKFITDLVIKGERNAGVIAEQAYAFAENDLQECDRSRTKFYPTKKTIHNVISSTKHKMKNSATNSDISENGNETEFLPYTCGENDVLVINYSEFPQDVIGDEVVVINYSVTEQDSRKHQLINEINSTLQSIQSLIWNLDENELTQGNESLKNVLRRMTSRVTNEDCNGLSLQAFAEKDRINCKPTLNKKRGHNDGVSTESNPLTDAHNVIVLEEDNEVKRLRT